MVAAPKRLKVFRTAVGFHDAYVAAPSKKAALEAWGAKNDLFAIGSAELVTDPELIAAPLAAPGKVIKRTRGSLSEQLAALPKETKRGAPKAAAPASSRPKKPNPRPSRAKLEAAEQEMQDFQAKAEAELRVIEKQEEELRRRRAELETKQRAAIQKLQARMERAREAYEAALEAWRGAD